MGLLTKYVDVHVGGRNIKHLIEKGYKIPTVHHEWGDTVPRGTVIKVKAEDLMPNCREFVDVECDYCNNILKRRYYQYTSTVAYNNGLFYCKNCSSKAQISGKKSVRWDFNKTTEERENGRNYQEYNDFIKRVLARDNYTCQCCGKKSEADMQVHHLDGYNWCVDKRIDDTNAITLCSSCHSNFHATYGKGNNTKEQFEEWIGKTIKLLKYTGEITSTRQVYCIEDNCVYVSAEEMANFFNISFSIIYSVCNRTKKKLHNGNYSLANKTIKGKHFLWYDEYLNMTKEDIDNYLFECNKNNTFKSVICLTTGEIFKKVVDASKKYNLKNSISIINCCKGRQKTAGKLSDGTKLCWAYYNEDSFLDSRGNKDEDKEI